MGSGQKKSRVNEQLEALEATVHAAISDEDANINDKALEVLIEVVLFSDGQGKPLFKNPLYEPLFYRQHFLPWVREGLRIKRDIDEACELKI